MTSLTPQYCSNSVVRRSGHSLFCSVCLISTQVSGPGKQVTALQTGAQMLCQVPYVYPPHRGAALAALSKGLPHPLAAPDPTASSGALHLCHDASFYYFFPHGRSLPLEYEHTGAGCLADYLVPFWIRTWHRAGHVAASRKYGIYGEAVGDRSANQSLEAKSGLSPAFVNTVLWDHSMPSCFYIVYSCFHAPRAEVHNYDRAEHSYYLAFCRKSLLSPAVCAK